jgi:hypothetical protein
MSLNIYGWATMPGAAPEYAALIEAQNVDVLGIQEGNWDWEIEGWPTDYSRSEQLHAALGECWQRRYQIFVNTCRGAALDSHRRFDLTDGPRAVRTGETALVTKSGTQVVFINIHWDHESAPARAASALETAAEANRHRGIPALVAGDFNTECTGDNVNTLRRLAEMDLVVDAGIDCILARDLSGTGAFFSGEPSDHPALTATFEIGRESAPRVEVSEFPTQSSRSFNSPSHRHPFCPGLFVYYCQENSTFSGPTMKSKSPGSKTVSNASFTRDTSSLPRVNTTVSDCPGCKVTFSNRRKRLTYGVIDAYQSRV